MDYNSQTLHNEVFRIQEELRSMSPPSDLRYRVSLSGACFWTRNWILDTKVMVKVNDLHKIRIKDSLVFKVNPLGYINWLVTKE